MVNGLILSFAVSIFTWSPYPAEAGRFMDLCGRILMGKTARLEAEPDLERREPRGALTAAKRDYRNYVRTERARGNKPPVKNISYDSSLDDLFFGFHYWWMPGNVWHNLMIQENSVLASETLAKQTVNCPDVTERPQNTELIDIPRELPPTDTGGGFD